MNFGERLKHERKRLGLLQTQACEAVGVSKSTWLKWEAGKTAPTVDHLAALGSLGMDVLFLVLGGQKASTSVPFSMTQEDQDILRLMHESSEVLKRAALAVLRTSPGGNPGHRDSSSGVTASPSKSSPEGGKS